MDEMSLGSSRKRPLCYVLSDHAFDIGWRAAKGGRIEEARQNTTHEKMPLVPAPPSAVKQMPVSKKTWAQAYNDEAARLATMSLEAKYQAGCPFMLRANANALGAHGDAMHDGAIQARMDARKAAKTEILIRRSEELALACRKRNDVRVHEEGCERQVEKTGSGKGGVSVSAMFVPKPKSPEE